ncbi:unnamed protein product [Cylicocyclus nassatus]|uniref:Uncharacterized protein n=1 Tax=Cylicocyclus nassatus TaxID=53992 RepID=A0AA36HBG4_CYLNA|nr:unnamed protein product [Cylicocyclus nassatus]
MRMCNVLVLPLILAGVSLQNEVNGTGDEFLVAKAFSARPTAYLNQEITSDAKSSSAKKSPEAPREQQHFFEKTSDRNFPVETSESQIPLRQQVGSSLGEGLSNELSGATSTSQVRQQLERTSIKQLPVVDTSQVPNRSMETIDGNEHEQRLKAAENRILTLNSLKTSSLKAEKATDLPKVVITTSENAPEETTVAVSTKSLRTTESAVTLEETTKQTQKTIVKTPTEKTTKKKTYKKTSTAKLEEAVTKETTKQTAPVITDLKMRTTERKRTIAVSKLSSKPTPRKTRKRTFAVSKPSSRSPYKKTKIKQTFATSKSTPKQTLIATVFSPTIHLEHMMTTNEGEETTDEEMIGIHNPPPFQKKRFENDERPRQTNKSALPFILGVIAGALVVAAVLASVVLIMVVHHRKRKGRKTQTESLTVEQRPKARKMPRKMESANINATKFSHAGPLVLDAKLKGPVRHALEDNTTGAALSKVQFDPKLNEIVDIGTDVDVINMSRMTTAATTTDTGHAVKKANQSGTMVPETAKISDRLFTDKKKPKDETATKNAALPPHLPTAAAAIKPLKETKPKA